MAQEIENQQARRFQPGDMARIVRSIHDPLIGRIVIVEEWMEEYGEWGVCLVSGWAFGASAETGRAIKSRRCTCRDGSLEPLSPATDAQLSEKGQLLRT